MDSDTSQSDFEYFSTESDDSHGKSQSFSDPFQFYQNHKELRQNLKSSTKKIEKDSNSFKPMQNDLKLKTENQENFKNLIRKHYSVVRTNLLELFLIGMSNYLQQSKPTSDFLVVTAAKFTDPKFLESLVENSKKFRDLTIIIDCTMGTVENIPLNFIKFERTIFVVTDEEIEELLRMRLRDNGVKYYSSKLDFNWNSLTVESQEALLKSEVNFQGTERSLLKVLKGTDDIQSLKDQESNLSSFSSFFDCQVLDLILKKCPVNINLPLSTEKSSHFQEVPSIKDDNFEASFIQRKFINKTSHSLQCISRRVLYPSNEITAINVEKLLDEIKDQHFLLFSDDAGTGKSWTVKALAKALSKKEHPRWISLVDLKSFTSSFKPGILGSNFPDDFADFSITTFFPGMSNYELNIFKELYSTGRVTIFFDGYDEIAPTFADFVVSLVKAFKYNSGNRLWIVTRTFYEAELEEKLKIQKIYKNEEFSKENGIEMICKVWKQIDSKMEDQCLLDHPQDSNQLAEDHVTLAKELYSKIAGSKQSASPQMCQLAAEVTANNKSLNSYKIFDKILDISYQQWSIEKGQVRHSKSYKISNTVDPQLNFTQLHMLLALQNLFPVHKKYCKIDPNLLEVTWTEEEIIGCGLVHKPFQEFNFVQKLFGYFFIAKFIVENLKVGNEEILDFLVEVIENDELEAVRKFLINGFKELKVLVEVPEKLNKTLRNKLFKVVDKKCLILVPFSKLNVILLRTIELGFSMNFLRKILAKVKKWTGAKKLSVCLSQAFKIEETENEQQLVTYLCESPTVDVENFSAFLEVLISSLGVSFGVQVLNNSYKNAHHACIRTENHEKFKLLWSKIDTFNTPREVKNIFMLDKFEKCFIFEEAWSCKNIEIHKILWSILLKVFKDDVIDVNEFSLVDYKKNIKSDYLAKVISHNNSDVLKFTLEQLLIHEFTENDIKNILCSNNDSWIFSIVLANNVGICHLLWNMIKIHYLNESDFEILSKRDNHQKTIIHKIAESSEFEVLKFVMNELHMNVPKSSMKSLLSSFDSDYKTFFHSVMERKDAKQRLEWMMDLIIEYFDLTEVLEIFKHCDFIGDNLLLVALKNDKELLRLTWDFVQNVINHEKLPNIRNLKDQCNKIVQRKLKEVKFEGTEPAVSAPENPKKVLISDEDAQLLRLDWINVDICSFPDLNSPSGATSDIHKFAQCTDLQTHKDFYKSIDKKFQERKKIIQKISTTFLGRSFIHEILFNSNSEVIYLTFNKIEKFVPKDQIKEILTSKSDKNKNLLQTVVSIESPETNEMLWNLMKRNLSPQEIADLIRQKNCYGNNLLLESIIYSTKEIFVLTWNQISKIFEDINSQTLRTQLQEYLVMRNDRGENIFHVAARHTNEFDLHVVIWDIFAIVFLDKEKLCKILKQKCCVQDFEDVLKVYEKCSSDEIYTFMRKNVLELMSRDEVKKNFSFCNLLGEAESCEPAVVVAQSSEQAEERVQWIRSKSFLGIKF